jgi:hypothetical protein
MLQGIIPLELFTSTKENNMEYSFRINEEHEWLTIIALAKSQNIKFCNTYLQEGYGEYPTCVLNLAVPEIFGSKSTSYKTVTFERFLKLMVQTKVVQMQLTDNYEAKIITSENVVKVGCQTFSFDKVRELATLVKEHM